MTEALSETRSLRSHPRRAARPRRTDYRLLLAVCAGGTAGGVSRAAVEKVFPVGVHGWPWATFVVNVVGTLLLGYFATRLQERLPPSTYKRPLLGTGFCGALTTFSTFQIEVLELVRHDRVGLAIAYLVSSIVAGLAAIHIATVVSRRARLR